ncbi:hypothetical protein ACRAWD_29880 [Caulobacter segnis]
MSKALGAPVLAIVLAAGVADLVLQGLGGWFGFGLFDWLGAEVGGSRPAWRGHPEGRRGRPQQTIGVGAERRNPARRARLPARLPGSSEALHALIEGRRAPSVSLVGAGLASGRRLVLASPSGPCRRKDQPLQWSRWPSDRGRCRSLQPMVGRLRRPRSVEQGHWPDH